MGLIGKPIVLADIANCEAFVQRTMDKTGIRFGADEREELLAEGLAILYQLHGKYQPGVGGRDAKNSRFSGYAAMFLPRRLGDAWHKMHPEHLYLTDRATGQRGWQIGAPMLSLDSLSAGANPQDSYGGERHLLHARTLEAFCHASQVSR